jgi:hypothetical protein
MSEAYIQANTSSANCCSNIDDSLSTGSLLETVQNSGNVTGVFTVSVSRCVATAIGDQQGQPVNITLLNTTATTTIAPNKTADFQFYFGEYRFRTELKRSILPSSICPSCDEQQSENVNAAISYVEVTRMAMQ